jgi:hypothetical protein
VHVSGVDGVLWALGVVGELLLLGILFFRGLQRTFPIFTAYLFWVLVSDPILLFVLSSPHGGVRSHYYTQVYFAFSIVQFILELSVLIEIGANVVRPAKGSLPKKALLILAIAIVLIGVGGFFFATSLNAATLTHPRTIFVADCTMAILRLVTFLIIAGLAQVLGLGWKNYVLQLASGLAFYAAVTLVAALARSHLRDSPTYIEQYRRLLQVGVVGYLCSLYYWCFVFVRKEAPRKEFSPQMAQLLVSISGSTKRQHSVAARSLGLKKR